MSCIKFVKNCALSNVVISILRRANHRKRHCGYLKTIMYQLACKLALAWLHTHTNAVLLAKSTSLMSVMHLQVGSWIYPLMCCVSGSWLILLAGSLNMSHSASSHLSSTPASVMFGLSCCKQIEASQHRFISVWVSQVGLVQVCVCRPCLYL